MTPLQWKGGCYYFHNFRYKMIKTYAQLCHHLWWCGVPPVSPLPDIPLSLFQLSGENLINIQQLPVAQLSVTELRRCEEM